MSLVQRLSEVVQADFNHSDLAILCQELSKLDNSTSTDIITEVFGVNLTFDGMMGHIFSKFSVSQAQDEQGDYQGLFFGEQNVVTWDGVQIPNMAKDTQVCKQGCIGCPGLLVSHILDFIEFSMSHYKVSFGTFCSKVA